MMLNIINNTLPVISGTLERHDKRSEFMNNDLREVAVLVKRRPCMVQDAVCGAQEENEVRNGK
jgi:hypothetical protein